MADVMVGVASRLERRGAAREAERVRGEPVGAQAERAEGQALPQLGGQPAHSK